MSVSGENTTSFELLKADEFCARMQIANSTLADWKKRGVLRPKTHYIQQGSIVRYFWELSAIRSIGKEDTEQTEINQTPDQRSVSDENIDIPNYIVPQRTKNTTAAGGKFKTKINLSY